MFRSGPYPGAGEGSGRVGILGGIGLGRWTLDLWPSPSGTRELFIKRNSSYDEPGACLAHAPGSKMSHRLKPKLSVRVLVGAGVGAQLGLGTGLGDAVRLDDVPQVEAEVEAVRVVTIARRRHHEHDGRQLL